jgi:hypothetical protein
LETFIEPKALVENPSYLKQRQKCLSELKDDMIDAPIIEIINSFNKLPYCFTLQCCYGHFLYNGQKDPKNFDFLPITNLISKVEYRIAYVAFCIENSESGKDLLDALKKVADVDPKNIQFCCAEWFWQRQVNSYALQVEPERYKRDDKVVLDYQEALTIEKIRNQFFVQLRELTKNINVNHRPFDL